MGFKKDVPLASPLERQASEVFSDVTCCEAVLHERCCDPCFRQWVRARMMEHWRGDRYWRELDRNDFALLSRPFHSNAALAADILVLVMTGNENLTILTWALETGRPLDQVVEILTVLDINARRLTRFAWMLPRRAVV